MMCVARTPWARDLTQHSTLGIMPPARMPSVMSFLVPAMSVSVTRVPTSSLSMRMPGTSVISTSFSAFRAAAISPAAVSALILRAWPVGSAATDAITGMMSWSTRILTMVGSMAVTSPTYPRSTLLVWRARMSCPSFPHRPTAVPPSELISVTRDLFTFPTSTISTTSMVASSVTRSPFLNLASMPSFPSQVLISGPPPCTSTGLIPTSDIRTRSLTTPAFRVGSFIAAPPYLITIVLLWNLFR
mmetsp:Transcript_62274/g.197181  ORF Transcript_62274/g.197181 Transcript_62274/m.197181 type:complete len:244 (+) Transcript_62274:512-1243(+)